MVDLKKIRVIALAEIVAQGDLVGLLHSLEVKVYLAEKLTDLPRVPPAPGFRDIILLPAECPDGEAWIINGVLSQYMSRPAFLVYGRTVDFARWSGVLDSGGTDLITFPFNAETLRTALERAAEKTATVVAQE
ncbi:hypothetical protein [Acidisarcina polymorpha]|uniref:hypothetical protein n=1 Tax=Acidisarcina polymorpha TaxID=2211140 RepID=UPI000DEEF236|nr:hypothetical protein [Acidisarcina polymorpha]